jgi:hypothetical protein
MKSKPMMRQPLLCCLGLLALLPLGACSMLGGSHASTVSTIAEGQAPGEAIDLGKVRADLSQLEADPQLAPRAPEAIKDAERALAEAQGAQHDQDSFPYLSYIADRKEQTARALAESKAAEDQLKDLRGQ